MIDVETQTVILKRIAEGESLRGICASEGMPARSEVHLLLTNDSSFADQYARAREAQMEHYADEILEIADDGTNDYVEKVRQDGSKYTAFDAEHVHRSRLRVDSRKWLMSKLAPKKYGEKVQIGGDPGNPIETKDVTDIEAAKKVAFLLTRAASAG